MTASNYDALLFLSFGGPEGPNDVMPFLANVLRGKNVPEARMLQVAEHYNQFGGVSPLNGQNRKLIEALKLEMSRRRIDLPVYWGNRNWHPMLKDTLEQMRNDGISRALAFVTSAYSSYSGCRQYLEDIENACKQIGPSAPQVSKIRAYFNHPGFIEANAQNLMAELAKFDAREFQVVFTAHSIPSSMAANCSYSEQLTEACRLVMAKLEENGYAPNWLLAYQSRSGPPSQSWLEPDVLDCLRDLAAQDKKNVVIHPIGFVSDHMEIIFDLDTQAKELAQELGLNMLRTKTAGTTKEFVEMICDLVAERLDSSCVPKVLGPMPVLPENCPVACCLK